MRLRHTLVGAAALGLAFAPAAFAARGSDGTVNILYWQAPSTLNPYLSGGTKEIEAASLVLEPLAGWDDTGKMYPRLATEIPTVKNGGISKDLTTVTWHLKKGLKWSDGSAVTADDVVFTGKYCMDPKGGCSQASHFDGVKSITAEGPLTVKITFDQPTPVPYGPFVGAEVPILQKKQFEKCLGANAASCTDANFNPVGTGPFEVESFKPNDNVQFKDNPTYREADKPAFAHVNFKGGGDAMSAARAVLQTGQYDYAWGLQLSPKVLADMEKDGKGHVITGFGTYVEKLMMNLTDPSPSLGSDVRSTAKAPNPILGDKRVREALSMALDRNILTKVGYGKMGRPTCDIVPAPKEFAADNTSCLKQDIPGAKKLLDEAGWKMGPDGFRHKDGKELKLTFQTSTNAVRQKFQAIIKQWWKEIGVDTQLKNVNGSVFFGGDVGSPDTMQKFYTDVEMYASNFSGTDPGHFLSEYRCSLAPRPATQWQGPNMPRYCSKEYDALVAKLQQTGDPAKRAALAKKLDTMVTMDSYAVVPLVWRSRVSAVSNTLGGDKMNAWDSEMWNIQDWYRKKS